MMNSPEPTSAPFMAEVDLLRARVHELERGQAERRQPQGAVVESIRLMALSRDESVALISSSTIQKSLHFCAQALVDHLEAAFARIWTLNTTDQMLELQARAGLYTHLDGPYSRVHVGTLKIGLIASEHLPPGRSRSARVSSCNWTASDDPAASGTSGDERVGTSRLR